LVNHRRDLWKHEGNRIGLFYVRRAGFREEEGTTGGLGVRSDESEDSAMGLFGQFFLADESEKRRFWDGKVVWDGFGWVCLLGALCFPRSSCDHL
jgi:hypothetical protein